MMNKKIRMEILVILLVLGISVVSCGDDDNGTPADNVSISNKKSPQVSSVTVTKTTNNLYYIISWDAVRGDGNSYSVYFKQDGKKSFSSIGYGQNFYKYDPATGDQINNDDLDKWSYRVSRLNAPTAGSYCFGVRTSESSTTSSTIDSDIKWADSITVTALPQISAVSAKITTDGRYLIASWDAVAGASTYTVAFYYKYSGNNYFYANTASGQNTYTYAESNGNEITNADKSKWSYKNYMYSDIYEYYFVVTPVSGDISVIGIAATSPTTVLR